MFRHSKIVLYVTTCFLLFIGLTYAYGKYNEYKLDEYVSKIDVENLSNDVLYLDRFVNGTVEVSIDTIVFKLELEKMVYNISPDVDVEYLELSRYSSIVKVRYKYKNKSKCVKYELIRSVEKTGD